MSTVNHSSHKKFYEYYANASQSEETRRHFSSIRSMMLRVLKANTRRRLSTSRTWVAGRERKVCFGRNWDIGSLGSATTVPWRNASMNVCLVPELLEHVAEWQTCLSEFSRILRPGGVLFLTTTNKLCPVQQEFNLPFYSWFPGSVKRRFEDLAITTRPELVNYATYPAVNWFSFYSLRRCLAAEGLIPWIVRCDGSNSKGKGDPDDRWGDSGNAHMQIRCSRYDSQ